MFSLRIIFVSNFFYQVFVFMNYCTSRID